MSLVVNLFAGPGSGKSTLAHGLMHHLKSHGVSSEFAHEWIKHPVWQGRTDMPQYYVWAKQQKLIDGLMGKVDVIVTDSPTLLSLVYGEAEPEFFHRLVIDKFSKQNNFNLYVDRVKDYWAAGRYQTEDEARKLDTAIHNSLHGLTKYLFPISVDHEHVTGTEDVVASLAERITDMV